MPGNAPFTAATCCLFLAALPAQDPTPAAPPAAPRVGLVLSGGGARGSAHVGVLKVLEELRIPVHCIAGTSMGSIVGGLYAYGLSPEELNALMTRDGSPRDWPHLLRDGVERPDRPMRRKQEDRSLMASLRLGIRSGELTTAKGIIQGQNLETELSWLTREAHQLASFDALPIPFRCTAVDLADGRLVVFDRGHLAKAMRASMSLPMVFSPARIDDREYLDGGLANNVPIDVARRMGATALIVVDIGTPVQKGVPVAGVLGVTGRMVEILGQQNIDLSLATIAETDVLVQPDLGTITSASFDRTAEAIAIGEAAARSLADKLRRFSVDDAEYQRFLQRQRRAPNPPPPLRRVTVREAEGHGDALVQARATVAAGEPLNEEQLRSDLLAVHSQDLYERVSFELRPNPDGTADLDVVARTKDWGTDYVRFGIGLETNFSGNSDFDLGLQHTARAMNALDAELRTDLRLGTNNALATEFYQPTDVTGRWFVAPRAGVLSGPVDVYSQGDLVAEADVLSGGIGLDGGVVLGTWGELRGGYERTWGNVDFGLSSVPLQDFDFTDAVVRVRLDADTLDNVKFPSRGVALLAELRSAVEDLGAEVHYDQAKLYALCPVDLGPVVVIGSLRISTALDGTVPVQSEPTIGGFLNLTGLPRYYDRGQHLGVATVVVRHRLNPSTLPFSVPLYVCGSFEFGNVWDGRSDLFGNNLIAGSAFLGADTPLGPLFVGCGMAEGEGPGVFLFLGQTL